MSEERITCPYCWESIDIESPAYDSQAITLTADCEVCCRPMSITYHWGSPQEGPFVEVEAEN